MTACSVFPESFDVVFGSFLLLELSVGSSYAAYATLRARVIPEVPFVQKISFVNMARPSHIAQYLLLPICVLQGQRATVTNLFRVPLNICVVAGTKLTDKYSPAFCFPVVAGWFGIATLCQVCTRTCLGSFAIVKNISRNYVSHAFFVWGQLFLTRLLAEERRTGATKSK